MIVTRKPGESDQDFRTRAFTAARENSANVAHMLNSDQISLCQANERDKLALNKEYGPFGPSVNVLMQLDWLEQATPMSWDEYRAARTVTELAEPPRMSRLRTIWYTCVLVAASAVVAMAVFGMGS